MSDMRAFVSWLENCVCCQKARNQSIDVVCKQAIGNSLCEIDLWEH